MVHKTFYVKILENEIYKPSKRKAVSQNWILYWLRWNHLHFSESWQSFKDQSKNPQKSNLVNSGWFWYFDELLLDE